MLPPLDDLVHAIRGARQSAEHHDCPYYVLLTYSGEADGQYLSKGYATQDAFLKVLPAGDLICFEEAMEPIMSQVQNQCGSISIAKLPQLC